jgi:hypothetical protein
VDKNLHDAWLEQLNALHVFDLISICEGHHRQRLPPRPHINLRMKNDMLTGFLKHVPMENTLKTLHEQCSRLFILAMTDVEIVHTIRIACERPTIHHDISAHISRRAQATSDLLDAGNVNWFEETVRSIQSLDDFVEHFLCN